METGNRRLIRPPMMDAKDKMEKSRPPLQQKKPVPPDQTNAENFYYVKQMQSKTPMVFVLKGGETLHGVIEWYDKTCLKINREEGPNLLVYKHNIQYMYKDEPE
jgi:sRNA-binding regulator protein Hfq